MKQLLIILTTITLFSCGNQNKVKMENEVTKELGTIELVLFKTKPEFSIEEVINSAKAVTPIAQKFDGYLGRKMALSNKNQNWLDLVYWTDENSANHAAQEVMKSETCSKFFSTIDESSMKMLHFTPVITTQTKQGEVEILELVLFKTKPEFTKEKVIEAGKTINAVLEKFDGYISRKLAISKEGKWMDLVYWTDLQKAELAAKAVMESTTCQKYFGMIEDSTMQFMHLDIKIKDE